MVIRPIMNHNHKNNFKKQLKQISFYKDGDNDNIQNQNHTNIMLMITRIINNNIRNKT